MILLCAGLSHREAPIAVREQAAIPADQLPARLGELRALPGVREALLLATCNRFEVWAAADDAGVGDDLLRALGPAFAAHARLRVGDEAARHLFRVTASLDSMVVGEAQIQGQVKEAAAAAQASGALGPQLSRALDRALSAAKRVRTETGIARGVVSVSSVAVELARKLLGDLRGRSVLLLGAGEMAHLAARELLRDGARELLVANRSLPRAEELAREIGGTPVNLEELPALLERVDVALCSTAAPRPVITSAMMAAAVKARRYRPIFLVDLALPRNVEPSANGLDRVYVYDLDDLEEVAAANLGLREAQVVRAEAIVEEELRALAAHTREREGVPVLAQLRARAEALARAEVERALSALPALGDKEQKTVRAMASAIVNKLLHAPTVRLRAEAGEGPLADAAAELFGLSASSQGGDASPASEEETLRLVRTKPR